MPFFNPAFHKCATTEQDCAQYLLTSLQCWQHHSARPPALLLFTLTSSGLLSQTKPIVWGVAAKGVPVVARELFRQLLHGWPAYCSQRAVEDRLSGAPSATANRCILPPQRRTTVSQVLILIGFWMTYCWGEVDCHGPAGGRRGVDWLLRAGSGCILAGCYWPPVKQKI